MSETKKIVFATNNEHKLREIKQIFGNQIEIVSLKEIGCFEDLPETADTISGNAEMKAHYVSEKYGLDCFADDTGLEVEELGGAPGVHTARYAPGEGHDSDANVDYLLSNLEGTDNRRAKFVTVIALVENGELKLFEGICNGRIAERRCGTAGFGYDPVFIPDGGEETFAEMGPEIKNEVSHRAKAVKKLADYMKLK